MTDIAISVRNVSKCYRVFEDQRSRLLHALWPRRTKGMQEIRALKDIDFEIRRGEAVAIIGRNGGGKSTLLEILTGTLSPTTGEVRVNGRVSALLELGSGFNPEYTGRDNVILNGLLLGLAREEILDRFDEIEAFAEIGAAIDRPVKTYSSGMMMRLAFAVQVLCEPDILIIDEALSVGDFFFQQKCLGYIRSLCKKGVTLLFVSHDMSTVRDICKRAIFLKMGQVQIDGDTSTVIQQYLATGRGAHQPLATGSAASYCEQAPADELEAVLNDSIWKAAGALDERKPGQLVAVAFYDDEGNPSTAFKLGSILQIKVIYSPPMNAAAQIAVVIKNKFDQVVTSLGSSRLGLKQPAGGKAQFLMFEMDIQLLLEAGNYSVILKLGSPIAPNQGETLDSTTWLGPVTIFWDYKQEDAPFLGMIGLPASGAFKLIQENSAK